MAEKNVIVYSTNTWPFCRQVKEYLSQKGVKFTEYNVGQDRAKAKEMVEKSGQMGVPVILVDDQIVVGFNRPKLDQLLAS